MPGLLNRSAQFCGCGGGYGVSDGIWSKQRGDITAAQLQKFWNALLYHARRELLKIDKQKLFEQARKNLYCSRCNGLLLEGFWQIIMYGKSLQLEDADTFAPDGTMQSEMQDEIEIDDTQDPSVHSWGGLRIYEAIKKSQYIPRSGESPMRVKDGRRNIKHCTNNADLVVQMTGHTRDNGNIERHHAVID